MIRINLIGLTEGAQSFERRRQLRVAYGVLGANVIGALVVSLTLGSIARSWTAEMATTKGRIEELLKVAHDVEEEERQRALLEEKRRVIGDLEQREVGPFRILEALSEATPTRLWLTEFIDRSGQVTITGLAIDDPTVAEFLTRLQRSPHFDGLELVESAQIDEGKTRVKKFVMRGPLSYTGSNGVNGHSNGSRHNGNGR